MHAKIQKKFSIPKMAHMAGMSNNNFHRIFKEALNDTPVQYIKKIA